MTRMRLGDMSVNCGCSDRRFIMFEAGRLGLTQAALLVIASMAVLYAARKVGH